MDALELDALVLAAIQAEQDLIDLIKAELHPEEENKPEH